MSELTDRVNWTRELPPFPSPEHTVGPDGSMTQLEYDLLALKGKIAAGLSPSTLDYSVKDRLKRLFGMYLIYATRQYVIQATGEQDFAVAVLMFKRRYGDPMQNATQQMLWFLSEMAF